MKFVKTIQGDSRGAALVITLLVLVLITAMVVEFAYGVYVNTSFLYNWQTSQKLSVIANSGVSVAAFLIKEGTKSDYTYPGTVYLPPSDPFNMTGPSDEAPALLSLRVEDENAKFNINTIVQSNNDLNPDAYEGFKRMLAYLELDDQIADLVADWIDRDESPRLSGSEIDAKNAPFDSVDELLLLPDMRREDYDKLSPYITIYGKSIGAVAPININGAEVPVLVTLSSTDTKTKLTSIIDEEMAERIVRYRENTPFKSPSDLTKVAGFESIGLGFGGIITVKGTAFRTVVTASSQDGIRRVVDCVLDDQGKILYWKEF